jgi:hypothetical protein
VNKFSDKQISDWRAYERVRQGSKWNMFDPRARRATGLSIDEYAFVMSNFGELKEQATAPKGHLRGEA